jgi:hypothetical protein
MLAGLLGNVDVDDDPRVEPLQVGQLQMGGIETGALEEVLSPRGRVSRARARADATPRDRLRRRG